MPTVELDDAIEKNLASYIEANSDSAPSDYKVARELKIARYALNESLLIHRTVADILNKAVTNLQHSSDPHDLLKLVTLANNLEERNARLTQNAKTVDNVAKQGAEIEMLLASKLDAAQVYSIIAQLPQLLLSLLQSTLLSYFQQRNYSIVNGQVLNTSEVVTAC